MPTTPIPNNPADQKPPRPPVSMENAVMAIGHPMRWKLLAELAEGEHLMISELAARVRRPVPNVSKQMGYLRSLGVAAITRRLHHLSDKFPKVGDKQIDFGWFVARFGTKV